MILLAETACGRFGGINAARFVWRPAKSVVFAG
jgi:hypothetical protein